MSVSALTLLVVAALALAALAVAGILRRPRGGRHDEQAVRRWASGRATTRDGVTAELHVEFVARSIGRALDEHRDRWVQDAMEGAVRRAIVSATLDQLPDAGDSPGWAVEVDVPDVVVEHAEVTGAEVWVTPELRRLVVGSGSGAWT